MMTKGSAVPDVAKKEESSEMSASASVTNETDVEVREAEASTEST